MITLITENWWLFLIAFLIGVFTAWWVWAQYDANYDTDVVAKPKGAAPEPLVSAPLVQDAPKPVAEPTIAVAPVALAASKPTAKTAKPKAASVPAKKTAAVKKVVATPAIPKVTAPKPATPKSTAKPKTAAPVVKAAAKPTKLATAPKVKPAIQPVAKPKPKLVIPDNLELLKGVGPKLNGILKGLGVTSFDQVANWTPSDIREVDSKLGSFAGRITRDNWIEQAKLLLNGDVAAFEKKYGSLGSEIKKG